MEFTMRIDMRNEAFREAEIPELARLIYAVGDQLADGITAGTCTDINGNTVGGFEITFPEEEEE